jgi:hypothetical protein
MAGNLNKTWKPDTTVDINVFAGTNLDHVESNRRQNENEAYNTYKNTTYVFDEGKKEWVANEGTVFGSDYATSSSIRTHMDRVGLINNVMGARLKTVDGTAFVGTNIEDKSVYSAEANVRENGSNFNKGNDPEVEAMAIAADPASAQAASSAAAKVDRNSSRVLDRSMFLNNHNSDILAIRGGSGVNDKTGEYKTQ